MTIEKPWGREELLEVNNNYVVKRLTMYSGERCSCQYHREKIETVYVLHGELTVKLAELNLMDETPVFSRVVYLRPGDLITILPGEVHTMLAEAGDVVYLESSTPQLTDVVRLEDRYGRC